MGPFSGYSWACSRRRRRFAFRGRLRGAQPRIPPRDAKGGELEPHRVPLPRRRCPDVLPAVLRPQPSRLRPYAQSTNEGESHRVEVERVHGNPAGRIGSTHRRWTAKEAGRMARLLIPLGIPRSRECRSLREAVGKMLPLRRHVDPVLLYDLPPHVGESKEDRGALRGRLVLPILGTELSWEKAHPSCANGQPAGSSV